MPSPDQHTDHRAEALGLIQWAVGDDPGPSLNKAEPALFAALQLAQIHSNLAIAQGQERVAEELRLLREKVSVIEADELSDDEILARAGTIQDGDR